MEVNNTLACILLLLIIMLLSCYNNKARDYFTPSNLPMETENSLLNRNPFDDMDYQTPVFYKM